MAFKFVSLFALVAAANAGFVPAGAPLAYAAAAPLAAKTIVTKSVDADYDPHPQYSYAYDVQDSLTGDFKSQHESRDGDVVQGSYSLLESDGTRRIVDYTADPVNGFNAVVHKEPAQVAVKAVAHAPLAVKTIAHAPIASYAAPVAPVAPVAKIAYAAPAAPIAYAQPYAQHYAAAAPALAKIATYAAPAPSAYLQAHAHYAAPAAYYH